MSLAGPLGDFDAPGSQLPLRFTSTPERAMILLPLIFCGNRDSIHNPVEHGENHQEETMKTPNGESEPKSAPRISYRCDGRHTLSELNSEGYSRLVE